MGLRKRPQGVGCVVIHRAPLGEHPTSHGMTPERNVHAPCREKHPLPVAALAATTNT